VPALFDLGEQRRVVLMSSRKATTSRIKYPHMFKKADLLVVNKIDLLPYVRFDVHAAVAYARQLDPSFPSS
jgi:hydrogenase nickel incorporation protein HypB